MVVGLYIFIGNSGVLAFGHIAFTMIGAYATAWFTLPVLKFLQGASEFERARCSEWILEGRTAEVAELLRNGASNGSLNASIAMAGTLIREAQAAIVALPGNAHSQALSDLGDALVDMLEQLRE